MVLWQVLFWAVLTVVLIVAEVLTVQLISIWFGAGSLVAFLSSFFGTEFYLQVILFIAVSIILLLATRPFVKRFLNANHVKTNSDSLVGKVCTVRDRVDNANGVGRVMVEGLDWSAKSVDDNTIFEPDERCLISEIQGVTLIIEKINK